MRRWKKINKTKAELYLAKQYEIGGKEELAKEVLNGIFKLCADPGKLSALSLYSCYAKAQEQMGEIFGKEKDRDSALDMYSRALDAYRVAEVLQPYWDVEFYLNFGLLHKRTAEEYWHLVNEREADSEQNALKAMNHLESALKTYDEIRERVPDMIDTYCKTCFAYVDIAKMLWQDDRWNEIVEKYLKAASVTLNEAMGRVEHTVFNRQLANIHCIITRTYGQYLDRRGKDDEAEQWFQKTLGAGDVAVQIAQGHPYGYMEAADGCLQYAIFLQKHRREAEMVPIAERGLGILSAADQKCSKQADTSEKIRVKLRELLQR